MPNMRKITIDMGESVPSADWPRERLWSMELGRHRCHVEVGHKMYFNGFTYEVDDAVFSEIKKQAPLSRDA